MKNMRYLPENVLTWPTSIMFEIMNTLGEHSHPELEGRVKHKMVLLDTRGISNLYHHFYSELRMNLYMVTYGIITKGRGVFLRTLAKFVKRLQEVE